MSDRLSTLNRRGLLAGLGGTVITAAALRADGAAAKTAGEIDAEVSEALNELFSIDRNARSLYDRAAGVMIIPEVVKGSFIVGGAYGEGALLINGVTDSYWAYGAASLGLQLGAQKTRQALFFMTQEALNLMTSARDRRIEVGADFEATVIDEGAEAALDTTQATAPVIAIVFGRRGLLAGASLAGGGYSRLIR
ncbi:MAG: lipid-binding SYLF domain-containing protein [Pseudomonadota bacterium]